MLVTHALSAFKKINATVTKEKSLYTVKKNGNSITFYESSEGSIHSFCDRSPNTDVQRDYSEDTFYTKIKDVVKALNTVDIQKTVIQSKP